MNRNLFIVRTGLPLGLALVFTGCMVSAGPPVVYASTAPPPPPATATVAETGDGTVYPEAPPPDPVPESPPPSPGYTYAWVNGYWDWNGGDWIWIDGFWAPRREGYVYYGPRFEIVGGRAVYYRSYWAGPGGVREYGYGYGPRHEPPAAYRARPMHQPTAWRAEHNEGWRKSPAAANWHPNAERAHAEPATAHERTNAEHPEASHVAPVNHAQPEHTAEAHAANHTAEAHAANHTAEVHPVTSEGPAHPDAAHPQGAHAAMPARTSPPGHTGAPPANTSPSNGAHAQQHPTNVASAHKVDEKHEKKKEN